MDHYIKREDVEKAIATIRKTYLKAKNFNALSAIDCVAGEIRDEVSDIPVFPIDCHRIVDAENILLDDSIYSVTAIYYPDGGEAPYVKEYHDFQCLADIPAIEHGFVEVLVEKPLEGEVFYYCKDEGGWQRRGITCGYA